ncbi:MAG: adenylate/guanylate cyclase domain-containing protein [Stappiaceae bacterium]
MTPEQQVDLFTFIGQAGPAGFNPMELIRKVGHRLNEAGLSVSRIGAGFPILHPTVMGFDITWTRHDDHVEKNPWLRSAGDDPDFDFDQFPFSFMSTRDLNELYEDLTGGNQSRFALVEAQAEAGATGYYATSDRGKPGEENSRLSVFYTSWTTDKPGGYSDEDLEQLRAIVPAIGTTIRAMSSYDVAHDLLRTYLGRNAARKVIEGSVARGSVEVIDASIIFADLSGFTEMADQESKEDLVELLNDYFEVLVDTVRAYDGEVLKFLGDGLLAIFPMEGGGAITKSAMDACAAILKMVDGLRETRQAAGKLTADISLALHRGNLLFGNVGSADRLDFTVIGPAVNEASRIEALCRGQQRRLIISSAFADSVSRDTNRLVSLGKFALRGVRKPQQLYTLDFDEEMERMAQPSY